MNVNMATHAIDTRQVQQVDVQDLFQQLGVRKVCRPGRPRWPHVQDGSCSLQQRTFTPFDPVSKRTEAKIQDADGKVFKVSEGAPQ
jgi:hypothetical protein